MIKSTETSLDTFLLALLPGSGEIPAANRSHLFRYADEMQQREILLILKEFESFAISEGMGPIESCHPDEICRIWEAFNQKNRDAYLAFSSFLLEGYYADPAVLKGAGLRHIPLFPTGMKIEQSDLSMLEQVFNRGSIYKT